MKNKFKIIIVLILLIKSQLMVAEGFTTNSIEDNIGPVISLLEFNDEDSKKIVITWTTNEVTNFQCSIIQDNTNNVIMNANLKFTKKHSAVFTKLVRGSGYTFILKSTDIAKNTTTITMSLMIESNDTDNDGTQDNLDAFPDDPDESIDTDGDGIGNNADKDDDNDGFLDTNDDLPLNPNEHTDTDHDGIGNNADTDDDNDGISDTAEIANGLNPLDASDGQADLDHDGFSNAMEISVGTDIRDANSKPVWVPIMIGDIITFVPAK